MKRILKKIREIGYVILKILRFVPQTLVLVVILVCIVVVALLALIVELGERSLARSSSILANVVRILGDKLTKEKEEKA